MPPPAWTIRTTIWMTIPEIAGPPNEDADLSLALLHAPEPRVLEKFAGDGYQLSLSGHTHGGQICLPGSRALVTIAASIATACRASTTSDR